MTRHSRGAFRLPISGNGINWRERCMERALAFIASLTLVLLISIFAFLALTAISLTDDVPLRDFLFGTHWNPSAFGTPEWGILPLFVGTVIVSALALLLSVPLGLGIALYLSEIASRRTREVVKPMIEMIASIPSIVLGLAGLLFVAPAIARLTGQTSGLHSLTASLLVALCALPTVASICEDALSGVPERYREASLALGATQWTTIRRIVIPAAQSGIAAAIMLGLGRIIGETMVVLMVAGNSLAFPRSLLDPSRPMTSAIAIEIKETVVGSTHWHALFAIGLVLFLITFLVNVVADLFIHRSHV